MRKVWVLAAIVLVICSCREKSPIDKYNELVTTELAKNKRVDSIFWDIYFGMPRKEFYLYCWEMNKKEKFFEGMGNMYVLYKLKDELNHPASMNFYPDFNDSVIWRMRVHYQYDGWVPWNKQLNADHLLPDLLTRYKNWYPEGNSFIELPGPKEGKQYVKVDGNRKIIIRKADDVAVEVHFTDLLIERQRKGKDAE